MDQDVSKSMVFIDSLTIGVMVSGGPREGPRRGSVLARGQILGVQDFDDFGQNHGFMARFWLEIRYNPLSGPKSQFLVI